MSVREVVAASSDNVYERFDGASKLYKQPPVS